MGIRPRIRVSTQVPFPALVTGSGPVALTKTNGVWVVSLNTMATQQVSPPSGAFANSFLLYFDGASGTYRRLTFQDLANTMLGAVGAVASVFGRTGQVTAQAGDYSFPQIAGIAAASQLPPLSGMTGQATPAQVPALSALNGAVTAGQVPALSGLSGAVTPAQLPTGQTVTWTAQQVFAPPAGGNCVELGDASHNGDLALSNANGTFSTLFGIPGQPGIGTSQVFDAGAGITVGTPSQGIYFANTGNNVVGIASAAQILAGGPMALILDTDQWWAAQAPVTLPATSGTINLDFSTAIHFSVTNSGNITFTATNAKPGQTGFITVTNTGTYTAAWTAPLFFGPTGAPPLNPAGYATVFEYFAIAAGSIIVWKVS